MVLIDEACDRINKTTPRTYARGIFFTPPRRAGRSYSQRFNKDREWQSEIWVGKIETTNLIKLSWFSV